MGFAARAMAAMPSSIISGALNALEFCDCFIRRNVRNPKLWRQAGVDLLTDGLDLQVGCNIGKKHVKIKRISPGNGEIIPVITGYSLMPRRSRGIAWKRMSLEIRKILYINKFRFRSLSAPSRRGNKCKISVCFFTTCLKFRNFIGVTK